MNVQLGLETAVQTLTLTLTLPPAQLMCIRSLGELLPTWDTRANFSLKQNSSTEVTMANPHPNPCSDADRARR